MWLCEWLCLSALLWIGDLSRVYPDVRLITARIGSCTLATHNELIGFDNEWVIFYVYGNMDLFFMRIFPNLQCSRHLKVEDKRKHLRYIWNQPPPLFELLPVQHHYASDALWGKHQILSFMANKHLCQPVSHFWAMRRERTRTITLSRVKQRDPRFELTNSG